MICDAGGGTVVRLELLLDHFWRLDRCGISAGPRGVSNPRSVGNP